MAIPLDKALPPFSWPASLVQIGRKFARIALLAAFDFVIVSATFPPRRQ
jgi:hypothetical protein